MSTELAAFFAYRGGIQPEQHESGAGGDLVALPESQQRGFFFAHERLRFGAIRVRTDGQRVVVAPESASHTVKEGYSFTIDADGTTTKDSLRLV